MKKTLKIMLAALLCAAMLFTVSCGKNESPDEPDDSELTPAEISEQAMENFVKKLQAGNYTCGSEEMILTTAVSPQTVYFTYPHEGSPTVYAYMTLNGETFATMIENGVRYEINFISGEDAIDAVGNVLPNWWYTCTGGNMFELFYNDMEKPLEFTSNDETVKYTVACLGGYGQQALELMQEVRMTLDAKDPTTAHFTAVVEDYGMYHYDDLDLTLTFGNAESESHIDAWYKNPEYPPVKTGWTRADELTMGTVFMRGYGSEAVPFPQFATYALLVDDNAYEEFGGVRVTDSRATEQDVEDYKAFLLKNGFKEEQEQQDDGSTVTVYRKLLRDEYKAYAELYPTYDNGFELIAIPYYEDRHYEGLEDMSAAVEKNGFAGFDETDVFQGWSATDEAMSRSESLGYFMDYEIYMPFILTFEDAEAAQSYWEAYEQKLAALGYEEMEVAYENMRDFRTPDGSKIFKCTMNEDSVRLDFKSEKLMSNSEMEDRLREFGIPSVGFDGTAGGRNQARYRYEISGFEGLFFTWTKYFANSAEAESFLDAYTAELDENGYMMTDPEKLGSNRQFMFFNEEEWKYVAFDYYPGDEQASIRFEFFAGDTAEEEEVSMMQTALGH